jgi:CheY-like chemotaxis protein
MPDTVDTRESETDEQRGDPRCVHPERPFKVSPVVLLVDDNHAAGTLTAATLQRLGCRIFLAGDGEKALRILESQSSVDIVVTDIDMPRVDGLELLLRIKQSIKHKDLPVILCSGHADAETIKRAAENGCVLYIPKPVEPDLLFEQITTVLQCGT